MQKNSDFKGLLMLRRGIIRDSEIVAEGNSRRGAIIMQPSIKFVQLCCRREHEVQSYVVVTTRGRVERD